MGETSDFNAAGFFEVNLDIENGHAMSIERDNTLIEPVKLAFALRNQLRLEAAIAVAANIKLYITIATAN